MTERALAIRDEMSMQDVMTIGQQMAQSGYFDDAKQVAQAVVKILAGKEMGFGPFASMVGINVIKGKPVISANLMASAVKAHLRYNYQVVKLDTDGCEIAFYEGTKELGRSTFTRADAEAAEVGKMVAPGATGSMLRRFPRNMFFSRALSNGVRWYCPDVFLGSTVYTPDEMGIPVDDEGNVIESTATTLPEKSTDGNGHDAAKPHWIDGQTASGKTVKAAFWAWATGNGEHSLALTEAQVYTALGVERIHDYKGTMDEAKAAILAWVDAKAERENAEAVPA